MSGGFGCDDGEMHALAGCAVSRKLNYDQAVEALRAVDPVLVAQLAFREKAEEAREQRRRNMRAMGLH